MARQRAASPPQIRSVFASRTAFDALSVDSGEESEEEQVQVEETPENNLEEVQDTQEPEAPKTETEPQQQTQPKLSKTAQKKAARAARKLAQEQKEKESSLPEPLNPKPREASPPPGTESNPVHIPPEPDYDVVSINSETPREETPSDVEPLSQPAPPLNGHATHVDVASNSGSVEATSTPPRTSRPAAFPTSPIDMAMRTASQSLAVTSPKKSVDVDLAQQAPGSFQTEQKPKPPAQTADVEKKRQNIIVRTLMTLIMISGFLVCLALGHGFMILLVMVCQTIVYREVTALFALGAPKSDVAEAKGKDPWSKTLNWYFFAVTNYFLYGESLIYYFKHVVFADAQLLPFATNHRFISFVLYMFGFVGFVTSLQKQYLKSQFGLFCWVHMSLLVIVVSSHFIVNNILEGLIWFWVPASLVICNDVFAYIFGITMGRTPLIKLSPKKTVEGFVGGAFSTVLFALVWGSIFMRFDYMICPARNLGVNALSNSSCVPNPVFVWREWIIPQPARVMLSTILGVTIKTVPYTTYHFHLLVMATFASLVAPFGGFFASGFKRAFNIKDFGHSIPGHGGMTDRMDCQFLMGVFTYVYYSSLVKEHHVTVGSILQLIVSGLTLDEQLELMQDFKKYLEGRGVTI